MTLIASPSRARVLGLRPATRIAESPRPMPHTVRLPYMSLRVAKVEAVTSQVRVPGLVTIGPTISFSVWSRIAAVDDERLLPQHGRVEGPAVAEAVALGAPHQADDVREAGGSVCRTSPKSMAAVSPELGSDCRYWQVARAGRVLAVSRRGR